MVIGDIDSLQMVQGASQRVDISSTIKMLIDDAERYEQAARSLRELAANLQLLRK